MFFDKLKKISNFILTNFANNKLFLLFFRLNYTISTCEGKKLQGVSL